ncbi:hypothetical protein OC834_002907 [Tilletia horrida]|nr:hypothetical protein OC834_002907 [Tilletia horrida]
MAITAPSFVSAATVSGLEGITGTEQRAYHGTTSSIYALPADAHEYDRLEKQHRLILHLFNGPISACAVLPVLDADTGVASARVLDVGCGPGSWINLVAAEHPCVEAHATDFAPTYKPPTDAAVPSRVEFQLGNVLHKLPYPDNHFDFVQMRFFTGALKVEEWPEAIAELHRIIKPGGWVQLVEPDGELRTSAAQGITPAIRDWNERGMRGSLRKRGGEPNAGVNLAQYARAAGFQPYSVLAELRTVPLSLKGVEAAPGNPEQKDHLRKLASLMIDDYLELVKTLAPILCQSWDITPQEMVSWGERVLRDAEECEAYHGFVTCIAQK